MEVKIEKNSSNPIYLQIALDLKEKIIKGLLPKGAVLPSERSLAKELGVHRNTVVKAYGALKDMELIDSLPGKGHFVIEKMEKVEESAAFGKGKKDQVTTKKRANWQGLIKEKYLDLHFSFDDTYMKNMQDADISFAAGVAEDVYGSEKIAEDLAKMLGLRENKRALITPYQGDKRLISAISKFARRENILAHPWEIQVLYELNQAMDFLVTVLLEPGDYCIVEEPVSPDVYRAINLAGGKIISVPVDKDGMIVEGLDEIVQTYRPKFLYVSTGYKDPTGTLLSLERREKLCQLSEKFALPIIEDNSGFDLVYDKPKLPSLKSMDTCGNVVYFYSFGLTFVPGMSLAFVIAGRHLVDALRYLVSMRIVTIDWIPQKLMAMYLEDGTYYDKVSRLCAKNKKKRDIMVESLSKLRGDFQTNSPFSGFDFVMPCGGAYIWCKLPVGVNARDYASRLMRKGVSVLPGQVFSIDGKGFNNYLRLSFTFESEDRVREGMDIFEEAATSIIQTRY